MPLALLSLVIISLGWSENTGSGVNRLLWFDACFNYERDVLASLQNLNQPLQPGVVAPAAFASGYTIPLSPSAAADTTEPTQGGLQPTTGGEAAGSVTDSVVAKEKNDSSFHSGGIRPDSVKKVDSLALDSTQRVKMLTYQRRDYPNQVIPDRKQSRFFAQSASLRRRTVSIDSTGKFVEIRDRVNERDVKLVLRVPIEEYISAKMQSREDELWQQLVSFYELKETKRDLGNLIKDITDFEIPLPSVGVLSIFGAPKISLRIGGAVDIHGAWKNESTEGVTTNRLGNTRNEPDFRQQVQINVNGSIGDKLQIAADWNTERTFEYENQLKIGYTGYEDEIIKSVEAGNVSLQTSSLVGGGEALFGVKANFKLGPLTLTALASQKKGEVKEKSVSGGSQSSEFKVRAYNYSKNHFFLDVVYADTSAPLNLFYNYYGNTTPIINRRYYVKDIEIWKSITQSLRDPNERIANVYIDLPGRQEGFSYPEALRTDTLSEIPGRVAQGRFIKLQDKDYILNPATGYVSFKNNINENDIIAVSYRIESDAVGPADDIIYGEFLTQAGADTSRRLLLKMIKPQNLQPSYKEAWALMLKNIYPLGVRSVKKEGFEFDLQYEVEGKDPQSILGDVRLLNAFGLDNVDQGDNPQPDGKFDYKPGLTIIPETGEIIFPKLQPFGRNLPANLPNPDTLRFNDVYDTSTTFAQQNKIKDKFILVGKSSGDASATYQLGFNIVENSVKVSLNGRELTAGVDYVVDYTIGSLTIRNDAALVPGANLRITYEENDLFQLASKTLFGVRGILDISRDTKLGFSALTLSQQTLSDKVRIGEEPLSNSIYGLDFSTQGDLPFLTKALDKIISTKDMSNFTLRGEVAYMSPDPNTKKSTISSDAGKSIAYIDDFEGAKRTIPVGLGYTGWKDLSTPDSVSPGIDGLGRLAKMDYKAKAWWFSVIPSNVSVKQIWPDKTVARGDEAVTVMDFVYQPDTAGTYNYSPKLSDSRKNWGGMMKVLSTTASNLVEENIEYIEFWAKVMNAPAGARINLDLGKISEDVIPNGQLNTEDRNFNELIDNGEDVGLDGLSDAAERDSFKVTTDDPSRDNFYYRYSGVYNIFDYFSINGTENNASLTDVGRFPDTEDLNKNGTLDQTNSYFRFEIPLDTNSTTNPYVVGGGGRNDSWFQYRIPLKDFRRAIGSPSLTNVEFIRLFVSGSASRIHLRFAEFNLVGNQWEKLLKNDSLLSVSVVNVEDNPGYVSPPGVARERDRSRPDQEIFRNEQSLSLIIRDLPRDSVREAVKYLFRPLDVFNYTEMKLFLHGDMNTGINSVSYYNAADDYAADVYFKFGADINNYYEYVQPVRADWNEISIIFKELTAIKQARDSANQEYKVPVPGKPGHYFIIKGSPALTQIKFLSVGIKNRTGSSGLPRAVSGEIWVNELRVIGADDTKGWAYAASASVKFADLMTVSVNISQTDPYFHRLNERFGGRNDSRSWSVSTDMDVLKLLPFNMNGSNLRVNYSRSESVAKPLYLPGTDIKVSEAQAQTRQKLVASGKVTEQEAALQADQIAVDVQSVNVSDSWAASGIKLLIPSNHWLIRDSFNSLTFSFNYNKSFSRNPTTLSNAAWVWNAGVNYGVNLNPDYFFYPSNLPLIGPLFEFFSDYRNIRIYYTPQSIKWDLSVRRNRSFTANRPQSGIDVKPIIARDFTTTRHFDLNWKFTENGLLNLTSAYAFDISSTLAYLELDNNLNQRAESRIFRDIFTREFFGKDVSFRQSLDFRTSPRLPELWGIAKNFTLGMNYGVGYQWDNDLKQIELGRRAQYSSRSGVNLTIKVKQLFAPWFPDEAAPQSSFVNPQREPEDERRQVQPVTPDTANGGIVQDSSAQGQPKPSAFVRGYNLLKASVKYIMFDYENVSVSLSNQNSFGISGIYGNGNGLGNLLGLKYSADKGPSRMFMLGLSNDAGPRARNGNLTDNYSQNNAIDLKTARPLWEGARIDLSWNVGWSITRSTSLKSDSLGRLEVQNITSTGTIKRSFLTLPPVFFLSFLKSGVKRVYELYSAGGANKNLSKAFVEGFESLPFMSRLGFLSTVATYIPRPNWRLTWDGLEKISFLEKYTKRVSLSHSYSSDYNEGWKIDPVDGKKVVQSQKISFGFQPLVGLDVTFNSLWDGNFSGSLKYSTRSGYDVGNQTTSITEEFNKEVGVSLNYSKTGFEIPLFGLALKNDIEFTFSYTSARTSTILYNMTSFNEKGTPQNGTTRVTIEPRIKYVLSARVNLSVYYRRTTLEPEGAARVPATTTNEGGLDVKISIQ